MYLDTSTLKKSGFRHINFENFGEISKSHLFVLQVDSSKPELVPLINHMKIGMPMTTATWAPTTGDKHH